MPPARAARRSRAAVAARLLGRPPLQLCSPSIRVPEASSHVLREVWATAVRDWRGIRRAPPARRCPAGENSTPSRSAARPPRALRRKVSSSALSSAGHWLAAEQLGQARAWPSTVGYVRAFPLGRLDRLHDRQVGVGRLARRPASAPRQSSPTVLIRSLTIMA